MYLSSESLLSGMILLPGGDIIIGFLGAFSDNLLIAQLGIHLGAGVIGAIIDATIGAIVLLLTTSLVRGGGSDV